MEQAIEMFGVYEIEEKLMECIFANADVLDGSSAYTHDANIAGLGQGLVGYVEPEYFQFNRFRTLYGVFLALHDEGVVIDSLTVRDRLIQLGKLEEVGGWPYITSLYCADVEPLHYLDYAVIIRREWGQRTELNLMQKIGPAIARGRTEEADTLRDQLDALDNVLNKPNGGMTDTDDISDLLIKWHADPTNVRGYRTGIDELDIKMGGLDIGELLILLGYTGSGKSTLMMQFAFKFAEQGHGLVVPTEMTVAQWKLRMIAFELGVDYQDLYLGQYRDLAKLLECAEYIKSLPISWFKAGSPTPQQIQATVKTLTRQRKCDWVIVDGVNDIVVPGAEGPDKTAQAISCLHGIARDGKVVACTAHMNRSSKDRSNKAPNPRDAFGSSRVEQLATRILTIWRPGHMVETGEADEMPEEETNPNLAHIRLAKSRFTETGKVVDLMFAKHKGRHGFWPVKKEHVDLRDYR